MAWEIEREMQDDVLENKNLEKLKNATEIDFKIF